MSTHGQQKSNRFCNGVGVIGYHSVGNLVILDENVNADNYVRTLSENLLYSVENIFGDRNHPFVFQHDHAPVYTARRSVAWLEPQDISTIQWPSQSPGLDIIEHVWDFMGREIVRVMPVTKNDLIRALQNKIWWLCLVPTSITRFASEVGYKMAKI